LASLNSGDVGKTSYFEDKCVNISKTVEDSLYVTSKVTITNDYWEVANAFSIDTKADDIDDLELYKVEFSGNFA